MRLIAAGILAVLLTACSFDSSGEPFSLDSGEMGLDDDLLEPRDAAGNDGSDINSGYLYLSDDADQLRLVKRQFRSQPTTQLILDALTQPPLANEIAAAGFLKTDLPSNLAPRHINTDVETGTITISVADDAGLRTIAQSDTARSRRIFAQIVCSLDWFELDDNRPISGVTISDSTGPIVATDAQTASIDRPATPADFNNCRSIPVAEG